MDNQTALLDSEFALKQFSGNRDLLVKMLNKFSSQYHNLEQTLKDLSAQQDVAVVKMLVHTVKGVSGNLGMKNLHLASREFELSLVDTIDPAAQGKYVRIVTDTLHCVQQFIHQDADSSAVSVTSQQNKNVPDTSRQTLLNAINRNEFITQSKLGRYLQELNLSADKTEALRNAINELDYSTARQLLQ